MLPGPSRISQEEVDKFIDPALQHNKKQLELEQSKNARILEEHGGCKVKDYQSKYTDGSQEKDREMFLYKAAMKIFCDFESGDAYKPDYQWPELP